MHTSPNYRVASVTSDIAEIAGALRQSIRITLPDALILATGQVHRANVLVAQDRDLRKARLNFPTKTLGDFLEGLPTR